MKKLVKLAVVLGLVAVLAIPGIALAAFGGEVTSFTPTPSGNGRAVAFDGTDLYYTYYGSPGSTSIYKVSTSGTALGSVDVGVEIGALAWDSNRGKLWAGNYDTSGNVSLVDFGAGTIDYQFTYIEGEHWPGYIDGLDYDEATDTLYIAEDWGHKVAHVATDGTVLHSWTLDLGDGNPLDNSGIEKVGPWLFVASPGGLHGPGSGIYVFQLDAMWGLTYTGQSIDVGGRGIEGIVLGEYNGDCVLWSNNAGANTPLVAYDLAGYCPVIEVDKFAFEAIDNGDGDGVLEVGEDWHFNIVIEVTNVSTATINDVVVTDNLGGDLELLYISYPGSEGPGGSPWIPVTQPTSKKDNGWEDPVSGFSVYWTGKTNKAHMTWEVGTLAPGESMFIQLHVSTDINTGTGNGKKGGHQEYTSAGPTELNSGATAKGLLLGWYPVEAVSDPINVVVFPAGTVSDPISAVVLPTAAVSGPIGAVVLLAD